MQLQHVQVRTSQSTYALSIMEFVRNCKLAARIDLRGLRCNACLMGVTFSSEVRVFPGDLTNNTILVVLSFLTQNLMLFRVGCWRLYCVLKRRWTAVRDCNSASHNKLWNCSCGVDIITGRDEGNQLAHARNPGMKKKLSIFLSDDLTRICVWQIASEV
jgi:hypothetical protein